MIGAEQAIAAGYAAFKRGDFAGARKALDGVAHVQAIQLLGLVEKEAGNYSLASQFLARAAQLDPSNPEIANSQGLLERLTGNLPAAEQAFRRALSLKPDFRSARLSLGRTLTGLERPEEAMRELSYLVEANSSDVAARIAYATAALEINDYKSAREHIEASLTLAPQDVSTRFAEGVLAFGLGEVDRAEDIFVKLLSEGEAVAEANYMMARVHLDKRDLVGARDYAGLAFDSADTSKNFLMLADVLWMSGAIDPFEKLVESALQEPKLALTAIGVVRKSGRIEEALEALDAQPETLRAAAPFQSVRSSLLLDLGRVEDAVEAGRASILGVASKEDSFNLVRALLASGDAPGALRLVEEARAAAPFSQLWLAYEATALRLMGSERYKDLIDYEQHVRTYELPVPEGFETLEAFNAALLSVLDEMNPFEVHPLNQSLRGGVQTPQDLANSQAPVLRAYFKALDAPIRDYMTHLGDGASHPSAERNTGAYRFSGGWSVRLGSGGHHVNHIHPRGWISSAYYVSVPPETASGEGKAGWIKFGEPPIRTTPELAPEKWVQPRAGLLVLFPSFLWHGTEPIKDGAMRVTAPFDIVPD